MASSALLIWIMFLTYMLDIYEAHEQPSKQYSPQNYDPSIPSLEEINLYIVPHTHLDPGWLETMETYYDKEVRDIISNILIEVVSDPAKRFTWAEVVFLQRYYEERHPNDKDGELLNIIRTLVESGRIELVGGGWVQHDETLSTYRQQITNVETGREWINKAFPKMSKPLDVIWQMDPFGASEITPLIFNQHAQQPNLRFKYQVLNRVGDGIKDQLKQNRSMDFFQTNSHSANNGSLLTHILHHHYDTQHLNLIKRISETADTKKQIGMSDLLQEFADKFIIP